MKTKEFQLGQTLVELVVAIGVVAAVLVALVSAVTSSLRYAQASRHRSIALKLAQEGMELTRRLRDTNGWSVFMTYATTNAGKWCVDVSGAFTESDGTGTCPLSAESPYWRLITFSFTDPAMNVTAAVSWGERTTQSTVLLTTHFTQWK